MCSFGHEPYSPYSARLRHVPMLIFHTNFI
jgi:hypothetical protein